MKEKQQARTRAALGEMALIIGTVAPDGTLATLGDFEHGLAELPPAPATEDANEVKP